MLAGNTVEKASSKAADGRDFSAVDSPGNTDVAMDDGKDGESE